MPRPKRSTLSNPIDEALSRRSEDVLLHLCRHVVALTWVDRLTGPANPGDIRARPMLVSGFLITTKGYLFWVTAGHILADIRRLEESGQELVRPRLMTGWHDPAQGATIPFPIKDISRLWLDHDAFGFDLGAVVIPRHFARLLATTGVRPIPRRWWAGTKDRFERHVLLGFPKKEQRLEVRRSGSRVKANFGAGTPLMRLAETDDPPQCLVAKHRRFFGRILSMESQIDGRRVTLDDIDGMSGGPIFGIRLNRGEIEYRLVAVQSSWSRPDRVIAGTPIKVLASFLARRHDEKVKETLAARKSNQSKGTRPKRKSKK